MKPKKTKALLLKVTIEMYEEWEAAAEALEVTLSAWIRQQCMERLTLPVPIIEAVVNAIPVESPKKPEWNFAERMAEIPKDEVDFWARSLPVEWLPKHNANSHRLTCMCANCLEYRRSNGIPYGGAPAKKSRFAK